MSTFSLELLSPDCSGLMYSPLPYIPLNETCCLLVWPGKMKHITDHTPRYQGRAISTTAIHLQMQYTKPTFTAWLKNCCYTDTTGNPTTNIQCTRASTCKIPCDKSKISHFQHFLISPREEYVGWWEIPVHQILLVNIAHCIKDLWTPGWRSELLGMHMHIPGEDRE